MEKFFSQNQWLEINYQSLGINLVPDKLPTSEFYRKFYEVLSARYESLLELPSEWINFKENTANSLASLINPGDSILSYGCGLGIIEKFLIEKYGIAKIVGYDFAESYNLNYRSKQFLRVNDMQQISAYKFNTIILSQVLYSLSQSDAIELLKKLATLLHTESKIIIINTSLIDNENGFEKKSIVRRVIENILINSMMEKLNIRVKNQKNMQGWGYHRDNSLYAFLANKAGFDNLAFFSSAHQSFMIVRNYPLEAVENYVQK